MVIPPTSTSLSERASGDRYEVSLLSLELLIKNKEATGRPKDQVDADELKRLRVQGG